MENRGRTVAWTGLRDLADWIENRRRRDFAAFSPFACTVLALALG
jgi:hypothetical protein